jgi:uncharacterized repeat protein (TIGR01451 family)
MKKKPSPLLAAFLAALLATLAAASPGVADAARQRVPPKDERAGKPPGPSGLPSVPQGTVSYGGTIVGGPEWDRPFADCSGVSTLGPVRYHVEAFSVGANGSYTVNSVQPGWDGFILVYQGFFNPAAPNSNCLAGNDDGNGGIGTSDLEVPLTASVQYLLVTTAFENGEEGAFTNTFDGPGPIILGALGGQANLSLEKSAEIPAFGEFDYLLVLRNAGPDDADSVSVVDQLPANVSYVSDNCGGFLSGPSHWTWPVGAVPAGSSASCFLRVEVLDPLGCAPIFNLATASATPQFDPDPSDNVALHANFSERVADGGFEGGSPNADWIEASANFGTPLCTVAGCGTGTGTGPHEGDWWAWFGGIATLETASMTQVVTIPPGSILSFFFEAPICSNPADFVRIQIDGTTVWEATGTHPQCNTVGYLRQTANITAFDDGGSHDLVISSITAGNPGLTNFFIDDVSISVTACPGTSAPGQPFETTFDVAIPTLSKSGALAMAALVAAAALLMVKRR